MPNNQPRIMNIAFPLGGDPAKGTHHALSQEDIKRVLLYDRDTGFFRWLVNNNNGVVIGRIAGCGCKKSGYWRIRINQATYLAHRLAWLYEYGYLPEVVDHINHLRDDNRINNLRAVSHFENAKNHSRSILNSTGCSGVVMDKRDGSWKSQIWNSGKCIHLGCYKNKQDAIMARKEAEVKFGYHPNTDTVGIYGKTQNG